MGVFEDVKAFYESFNGDKRIIGYSVNGLPIFAFFVRLGAKPKNMIVQCTIHAREYVTAYVGLKLIEHYGALESGGASVGASVGANGGGMWVIPLLNPDGCRIAQSEKPLYKANANGVDLNTNFDARWGTGQSNVQIKGDSDYIGPFPFSEPETVALRDFTLVVKPSATISYHTKGGEIYFDFFQNGKDYKRDKKIAAAVSDETGYNVVEGLKSAGGYKDWCVAALNVTALTIEIGENSLSHPIKKENAERFFIRNKNVPEIIYDML